MSQTPEGAIKALANKNGIPLSIFLDNISKGLKWCYRCKLFHPISEFGSDSSRYDGLTSLCIKSRNERQRENYIPVPPEQIKHGPDPNPPRDMDKRQARQRVNVLVRTGKLPHPNTLLCSCCGHIWKLGDKRHQYHHFNGYMASHHLDIEPLCSPCHAHKDATWKTRDKTNCRNGADKIRSSGMYRGDGNPAAKITWDTVRLIRAEAIDGITDLQLSAKYMISRSQIRNIRTGKSWIEQE